MTQALQTGDKAPDFTLPSDGSGKVSLKDYSGQTVVLYFYPKDDTPGCTKEAIAFSEHLDQFRKAEEVGVTDLLTMPWAYHGGFDLPLSGKIDGLKRFADEVVGPLSD